MKVTNVEKKENSTVELTIHVEADEFEAAVQKAYLKSRSRIAVPGFRKGKAPRKIIEGMYGSGVFYEDAINDVYPGAYEAAVKEQGLEDMGHPVMDIVEVNKEKGLIFTALVSVRPEAKVKAYKGLTAPKAEVSVTDEDVENELQPYVRRATRLISVDREVKLGDTAVIDFEGFEDGKPFEGGKGENYSLTLGSGQFIPGFEEQIVGHNTGDEFEVNVTFPEDYQAEELKGKATTFKCKLHEIKMKELPEVDDEFVKDVSEFDTLADYKEDLKKKLAESKEKEAADDLENQLIDKLVELVQGEIPEAMYENKIADSIREFGYRLQSQGLNLDTYMKYTGMNVDQMKEGFRPQAERQVKLRLALEKIAALEELKAGEEDLNQEYQKIAEQYKMEADKIKELIPAAELEKDICVEKAINLVRDNANIKDAE